MGADRSEATFVRQIDMSDEGHSDNRWSPQLGHYLQGFMVTTKDPEFLADTRKAKLDCNASDGNWRSQREKSQRRLCE
jgi:hypothetical protein